MNVASNCPPPISTPRETALKSFSRGFSFYPVIDIKKPQHRNAGGVDVIMFMRTEQGKYKPIIYSPAHCPTSRLNARKSSVMRLQVYGDYLPYSTLYIVLIGLLSSQSEHALLKINKL